MVHPLVQETITNSEQLWDIFGGICRSVWRTRQGLLDYNKDLVSTARDTLCVCLCIGFPAISIRHQLEWRSIDESILLGLRDDVKDLLLSLLDPRTLNKAISQAVKCDNRLFQHRQDQHLRQQMVRHSTSMTTNSLNLHSEMEDIQILPLPLIY